VAWAAFPGGSVGQIPPLVCYGNEPSWSLELGDASARWKTSGEEEVDYVGRSASLARPKVQGWRGQMAGGRGGDLVAFVTEAACTDGMSDVKRPYGATVSLPDGRIFAGCCRPDTLRAQAPSGSAPAPPSAPALGFEPPKAAAAAGETKAAPRDWADSIDTFLPALKLCTYEALRTEGVVFAEELGKGRFHLVLRLPGRRLYADCKVPAVGPASVIARQRDVPLNPAEQVAILTLLPGEPPRGKCDRTEPALDDKGIPFGWITRKGC